MIGGAMVLMAGLLAGGSGLGCRKVNPAWLGPGEGTVAATQGTGPSSATGGSTAGVVTGGTTLPAVMTVGAMCGNNGDCAVPLRCGPLGCQWGQAGEPCDSATDCGDDAPVCTAEGVCDPATLGQPCQDNATCEPLKCGPTDVCQAGRFGDPCDHKPDCEGSLKCVDGRCGG